MLISFAAPPLAAAQTVPGGSTWTTVDLGAPPSPGTAVSQPCTIPTVCPTYAVTSAGAGIAGAADQFTFVYQRLTGDGTVTMRLASLVTTTGEAGVMMREAMTLGARHVTLSVGSALAFKRRTVAGGSTSKTLRTKPTGAVWLRLERTGTVITAATSTDGSLWTSVGSQTLALATTLYVGIAVDSGAAVPLTASVSNFAIASTATLPEGWATADVGQAPYLGSASYESGTFLMSSSGVGLVSAADAFRLTYVRVTGDATIIARVAATQGPSGHLAGIMFRDTLDPGSRQIALTAKDGTIGLTQRSATLGAATTTGIASGVPPVWLKLERRGTSLTPSFSADGTNWTTRSSVSIALAADLYAGVFVAGGSGQTKAAAAFDHANPIAISANLPPTVSLTSPSAGKTFVPGTTVTITAAASDADDVVARVEFMVNGTRIASDTAAPFSSTWVAGASGTYTLTAKAIDSDGATATSAPVSISTGSTQSSGGSMSWRLAFEASFDHESIDYYGMDVFLAGTRILVVSKNLGKPVPAADRTIQVDVSTLVAGLPVGFYDIVVRAVDGTLSSASLPSAFSR